MILAAIDTATRQASVALYDERGVLAESSWRTENRHSVETLPVLKSLMYLEHLQPSSLGALAVASGPGSFTGLRIGMSLAKGLALALDLPIVGIPTLAVTAYVAGDPGGPLWAVMEAGRGRLCIQPFRFEEGLPVADSKAEIVDANAWTPDASEPVLLAGELRADVVERLFALPDAENIAIASLASSVRRAGYLAELAWERVQRQEVDDLDTLDLTYVQ
ncbi:MAG: tRNA (adenosine(37)-N6)-threonylcarbamoyltransferase complex dimerization subunit type 1 TsaB [Anaerolineae bacterium]